MAQLVKGLTLDFGSGHDLMVHGIEFQVGLCVECGAYLGFSLSLSLLLPCLRTLSHSTSFFLSLSK